MSVPPTLAHQASELSAAVLALQLVTTGTAGVWVEFASAGTTLDELDVLAPPGQVEQRSAIVARPAWTVRIHPREMTAASSRNVFTFKRRDVARSVIGQP